MRSAQRTTKGGGVAATLGFAGFLAVLASQGVFSPAGGWKAAAAKAEAEMAQREAAAKAEELAARNNEIADLQRRIAADPAPRYSASFKAKVRAYDACHMRSVNSINANAYALGTPGLPSVFAGRDAWDRYHSRIDMDCGQNPRTPDQQEAENRADNARHALKDMQ